MTEVNGDNSENQTLINEIMEMVTSIRINYGRTAKYHHISDSRRTCISSPLCQGWQELQCGILLIGDDYSCWLSGTGRKQVEAQAADADDLKMLEDLERRIVEQENTDKE